MGFSYITIKGLKRLRRNCKIVYYVDHCTYHQIGWRPFQRGQVHAASLAH